MLPEPFAPLTLARILRPWGRHGEVAAQILTDFPERLTKIREVWLAGERRAPRPAKIISCRIHLGQAIFHFDGIQTISDAEALRGLEVQIPLGERVRRRDARVDQPHDRSPRGHGEGISRAALDRFGFVDA